MVINENNSYINSFTKGMNSDLAYDQLPNTNYTYAENIRITKNQLIGDIAGDYSSVHEGIVTPVYKGVIIESKIQNWRNVFSENNDKILACDTVDNLGVIITKSLNNTLALYEFKIENDIIISFKKRLETKTYSEIENLKSVSLVLYKELDNVIKAYIATGIWPIFTITIDNDDDTYGNVDVNDLINNRIVPEYPIYISNRISGLLKTSLVQYTYRFYNKYGITTRLAPLTNKIQVIDSNRNKEIGNAEDTKTSIGFVLLIKGINGNSCTNCPQFKRMQIYRILYIKENEDANVFLIYDGDILESFNDVGTDPLQILTMEEFSSLSGILIIPRVIEKNQEYLFASNVNDDTIIAGVEIDSAAKINPVITDVKISKTIGNVLLPNTTNDTFTYSNGSSIGIDLIDDYYGRAETGVTIPKYFEDRNINSNIAKNTYNNNFTSSLLRSLRRGELYVYGIVYYDKYGRRSDVINIGSISTPNIAKGWSGGSIFRYYIDEENSQNNCVWASPIGVRIKLPQPKINGELVKDIIGCQIVRRSSKNIYLKTLLQVALARPIRQGLRYTAGDSDAWTKSPYYPLGILTSDHSITSGYYGATGSWWEGTADSNPSIGIAGAGNIYDSNGHLLKNTANSFENKGLFLIFSSEIDFRRDDTLSNMTADNVYLHPMLVVFPETGNSPKDTLSKLNSINSLQLSAHDEYEGLRYETQTDYDKYTGNEDYSLFIRKRKYKDGYFATNIAQVDKTSDHLVYGYYHSNIPLNEFQDIKYKIIDSADVKIPKWYEGFSNTLYSGAQIIGGIKQYKQFETSLNEYVFNNWVSFGLYDLLIFDEDQPNTFGDFDDWSAAQFLYDQDPAVRKTHTFTAGDTPLIHVTNAYSNGFIGPGPSCLLIALDKKKIYDSDDNSIEYTFKDLITSHPLGTYLCNIEHDVLFQNNESEEQILYFGFGNYFRLLYNLEKKKYIVLHNYEVDDTAILAHEDSDYMIVFDGDIYITPHELTTMYKAYDFNSKDTLCSMLITNYVPMESKVNTFFDYGMNYLNTQSANLLYEAGSIDGVISQDRPAHLYNMIYSNNDVSNDVFSLISTDKNETNYFPHRTYYSEPKINGEFIDSFNIFKAVNFIDVDSKYGQITNLLTDKNILYYWLDEAFGKFSVNERSLINDQNGNTIMLGQAGILSRFDYINTRYGMRPYDYSAIAAEGKIYWIDINNRAIVVGNTQEAANLGEQLNVQNIINNKIDVDNVPEIDYDLQNNELLCKCLKDGEQIVFNVKYNIPTSIYTRQYNKIAYIYNHIYGIDTNDKIDFVKYNYLSRKDVEHDNSFLTPIRLSFVINQSASVTKVFDSQTVIPIKRATYIPNDSTVGVYFNNVYTEFETDIIDTNTNSIEPHTDREGNIIYSVPRYGNNKWGNRMRGKWLRTYIEQENPHEFFTISHVITKLRQSYS